MTRPSTLVSIARQRGVATLIAAVLLLSVVAVALFIGLLNANTNITNTSLQADGVEALFIAESGLENAIRRFNSGVACDAALSLTATVGRGSFSIGNGSTAGLAAQQCRVQVTGTITQSNTARTIEAVITRLTTGGSIVLGNPGFETGGCPPGADGWTITNDWGGGACGPLVNNPPGSNDTRVLYSRVVEGGNNNLNLTTAQQTIACTTAAGGNTVFSVRWGFRYDESATASGPKQGAVSVRFIDSAGTSYPSALGAIVSYTNDVLIWSTSAVNITVPATRTLTSFVLVAATFDRATVELWVDDISIARVAGPGCQIPAQALTWAMVPRP